MSGPWEKFQPSEPTGKPWEAFRNTPQEAPGESKSGFFQGVGNLAAGTIRGAGSIGATILAPYDIAKDALAGKGLSLESNRERRKGIDGGLEELGAQPDSISYQGGKLVGEIAGTLGVPGVLAKGAQALGAAPSVVNALASGGFRLGSPASSSVVGKLGDAALRTGAGGTVGLASAGLVNPEDSATGAVVGAALPNAVKAAGEAGKLVRSGVVNTLGASTGTSAETVRAAFNAGKSGSDEFIKNMRGGAEFDDVVATAKQGLEKMRADRAAQYKSGMAGVSNDKTVLDFAPIDDAINRVISIGKFKGVQTNKNASGVVDDISETVSNWKSLNPAEYHTPEGLDALKRAIGDIRDSTQFGTPGRKAADAVYNSVKNEITRQAPKYAEVMSDYAKASQTLDEITRTLSLGDKAAKDTAIRKLQSLMRNNAQTNYGNRLSLAEQLQQAGGVEFMPAIAGQSMNSWMPRGMVGAIEKGAIGLGSIMNPALLAAAPIASPRAVGEASYALGRAAGGTSRLAQSFNAIAPQSAKQITEGAMRIAPILTLVSQKDRQ